MLLIYEPVGGERQQFDYKPNELMSIESEAIEDVGGPTWGSYSEFTDKLSGDNLKARRALLWIMLRRQNPRLQFVDLVVRVDEITLGVDDDDLREFLASGKGTPEERADAERMLAERAGAAEAPAGKDEPGDSATDSPSPTPDSEPLLSNSAGL